MTGAAVLAALALPVPAPGAVSVAELTVTGRSPVPELRTALGRSSPLTVVAATTRRRSTTVVTIVLARRPGTGTVPTRLTVRLRGRVLSRRTGRCTITPATRATLLGGRRLTTTTPRAFAADACRPRPAAPAPAPTPSPSATAPATATPTATAVATASPTPTAAPDPSPSATPTASPTPAPLPRRTGAQMFEFFIALSRNPVAAGKVEIVATNGGEDPHSLAVEDAKGTFLGVTPTMEPREPPSSLNLDLAPGTYTVYCPLLDHEALGMTAELRVEAP